MRNLGYFTIADTSKDSQAQNGGSLYSANIKHRLREEGIPFVYIMIDRVGKYTYGSDGYRQLSERSYAITVHPEHKEKSIKRFILKRMQKIAYMFELEATKCNDHLKRVLEKIIKRHQLDALVTDSLYGYVYLPKSILLSSITKYLISCNDEVTFFQDILSLNHKHITIKDKIALMRFARFQKNILHACKKIIFISSNDKPKYLSQRKSDVITCYFDFKEQLWEYSASKNIYFIGNYGHYPNRLAVDYIVKVLAPILYRVEPSITIDILGASPENFSGGGDLLPNINFMGVGTAEDAQKLFLTGDLLICPVSNKFGQKIKIAEAISYGSPFLASNESMLGYPYFSQYPRFSMDRPDDCVSLIVRYLNEKGALQSLHRDILQIHKDFIATQRNIWTNTLFGGDE